jgi:hypothetical protein
VGGVTDAHDSPAVIRKAAASDRQPGLLQSPTGFVADGGTGIPFAFSPPRVA